MSASTTELVPGSPPALLQLAIEKGADLDQLGKLMDLKERWDREEARKAFFEALSRFQGMVPQIRRDQHTSFTSRRTGDKTEYGYASLGAIAEAVRGPLEKCSLTYRWKIEQEGSNIIATFILTHAQGHSEVTTLSGPLDDSGYKNPIQQRGSTVSYLQRYTLISGLGLSTALEDDDGGDTGPNSMDFILKHMDAVREHFTTIATIKEALKVDDYEVAAEAWAELSDSEKVDLWKSKKTGGVWWPSERDQMRSDEFKEIMSRINKQESTTGTQSPAANESAAKPPIEGESKVIEEPPASAEAKPDEPDESGTYTVDYLISLIDEAKSDGDFQYVEEKAKKYHKGQDLRKIYNAAKARRTALEQKATE